MKTIYQTSFKKYRLSLLCMVLIGITSCGSFKNSSYEDIDGIYGSSSNRETTLDKNQTYTQTQPTNVYVEKFKQMEDELAETEYFTDVDSYSSNQVDTVYVIERSYAGWGNNASEVNVNYYNTGWNNWGWGWNSWYGPGWNNGFYYGNTWGWNNWGWNNWGLGWYGNGWNNWCNPYFGNGWNNWGYGGYYNNNIVYNSGRRGMNGYYPANSGRVSGRTATVVGRNAQIGKSTVRSTRPSNTSIRNNNTRTTTPTRSTTPTRTTSPTRTTTPTRTTSPSRTNTPTRTTTTPRSNSSSSGSFGGSKSSGGGRSSSGSSRGGRGGF